MDEKRRRFADLLSAAIQRIKKQEGKPINLIQDELGYHMHLPALVAEEQSGKIQEKGAGTTIEYWRKGNIPPSHAKIERLARELVRRAGMEQSWLKDFLDAASFGTGSEELIEELFGSPIHPSISKTPPTYEKVPAPFQAPALTPHFVGREAEFAQLEAMLNNAQSPRIVALVGMGGIGKTTLAVGLAHRLRARFKDGVLWAGAAYSNPQDVLQSWALAFDCDFSNLSDVESRAAAVRNLLASKRILIVIDDVRSLEKAQLLLPGTRSCVVLLTTRDHDIANALNAKVVPITELSSYECIYLLRHILGDSRVNGEEVAAQAICEVVQNLPLAVEISAKLLARAPWQSLAELAERLRETKDRLNRLQLKKEGSEYELKNISVRATFEVSWQALNAELRRLFALLGVFNGRPFSLPALAAVAEGDEGSAGEQAAELIALSLLSFAQPAGAKTIRFRQHPLLADFARERLSDDRPAEAKFVAYYLNFTEHNQQVYESFEHEWGNVMAAMQIAHQHQQTAEVLRFAELLFPAWSSQVLFEEAAMGLAWACISAESIADDLSLARHLLHWGSILVEQNQYDQAEDLLDKSLRIAVALEEDNLITNLYWTLARVAIEQSNYHKAEPLLRSCLETRRYLNDETGIASVYYWQAMIAFRNRQFDQAQTLCLDALTVQEHLEDSRDALRTVRLLLDIALERQAFDIAKGYAEQLQSLAIKTQDLGERAAAIFNVGKFRRQIKDYIGAEALFQQSLADFQKMGSLSFCGFVSYELSRNHAALQNYQSALVLCQQSVALLLEVKDSYAVVFAQTFEGDLYLQLGDLIQAHRCWHKALATAQQQNHPHVDILKARIWKNPSLPD